MFYQQLLSFHETFSFAFRKWHYYIIACSVWHLMELAWLACGVLVFFGSLFEKLIRENLPKCFIQTGFAECREHWSSAQWRISWRPSTLVLDQHHCIVFYNSVSSSRWWNVAHLDFKNKMTVKFVIRKKKRNKIQFCFKSNCIKVKLLFHNKEEADKQAAEYCVKNTSVYVFWKGAVIPKWVFLQNFSLFRSAQLKPILCDEGTGYGPFASKWRISEWWRVGGTEKRGGQGGRKEDKDLPPSPPVTLCRGEDRKLHARRRLRHQAAAAGGAGRWAAFGSRKTSVDSPLSVPPCALRVLPEQI